MKEYRMKGTRLGASPHGAAAGFGFCCIAVMFALVLTGCGAAVQEFLGLGGKEDAPDPAAWLLYVAADGGADTAALKLVFSAAMDGLTAGDIEITPAGGGNSGITWGDPVSDPGNLFATRSA